MFFGKDTKLDRDAVFEQLKKNAATECRDSRWYNQVTNRAERLMERLEQV